MYRADTQVPELLPLAPARATRLAVLECWLPSLLLRMLRMLRRS